MRFGVFEIKAELERDRCRHPAAVTRLRCAAFLGRSLPRHCAQASPRQLQARFVRVFVELRAPYPHARRPASRWCASAHAHARSVFKQVRISYGTQRLRSCALAASLEGHAPIPVRAARPRFAQPPPQALTGLSAATRHNAGLRAHLLCVRRGMRRPAAFPAPGRGVRLSRKWLPHGPCAPKVRRSRRRVLLASCTLRVCAASCLALTCRCAAIASASLHAARLRAIHGLPHHAVAHEASACPSCAAASALRIPLRASRPRFGVAALIGSVAVREVPRGVCSASSVALPPRGRCQALEVEERFAVVV